MRKQLANFVKYETVRMTGRYNMATDVERAAKEAFLTVRQYNNVVKNYDKLKKEFEELAETGIYDDRFGAYKPIEVPYSKVYAKECKERWARYISQFDLADVAERIKKLHHSNEDLNSIIGLWDVAERLIDEKYFAKDTDEAVKVMQSIVGEERAMRSLDYDGNYSKLSWSDEDVNWHDYKKSFVVPLMKALDREGYFRVLS